MHTYIKYIGTISITAALLLGQSCKNTKETLIEERFAVTDSLISKLLIDTVQQANNRTELSFSAKISADEERQAEIFPLLSGIVQNVYVRLGDKVDKGQLLATLVSSEMAGFDKESISAAAELSTAETNARQAEELFTSGLSSARELQEAKNELMVKRAEYKRANSVMKLNGGEKNGKYKITSPLSGYVIKKNVTANMQLRSDNDKNLFTVADLSNVWAMINIYESDIARIREGDEVSISALSYPEKDFSGKINKVYNIIDNESKVMNARVSIANPGYLLKPGMMATVKVSAKSGTDLPVVNSRGVIFDENKNYVLVIDQSGKIRVQEITIGRKTADKVYINSGLKAGERIVASKQVFIYESLKN